MEKKIYEEELPHRGKHIDWRKIKNDNIKINFIYNEIEGHINILEIETIGKKNYATIQYKEIVYTLDIENLKKCKLGKLLKVNNSEFKIKNEYNIKLSKEKVGEINYNNNGEKMTIIKYNTYKDIVIEFDNGNIVNTRYDNFKNGEVKNTSIPIIFNIGYMGNGNYSSKDENHRETQEYIKWRSMIRRCYDEKYQEKHTTYQGCTVAEEWHNFQNFAQWYNDNCYKVGNEKMELDKDILIKNNKIYSPNTCILVPHDINILFLKRNASRGQYPIGVSEYKNNTSIVYKATCKNTLSNKSVHLGYYPTPEKAFEIYKKFKEKYIKEVADKYKDRIPYNLYSAMYNWKVEITD